MATEFENALLLVKATDFSQLDEMAVKQGAILPLLRQAGWNTENVAEVKPEHVVAGQKVDYALRAGGVNLIYVEAKTWKDELTDGDVAQLVKYCIPPDRPHIAVLTNGRHWRLYLPTGKKTKTLHLFLDFDITKVAEDTIEDHFREFLSPDCLADQKAIQKAMKAANALYRDREKWAGARKRIQDYLKASPSEDIAGLIAEKAVDVSLDQAHRYLHDHKIEFVEATSPSSPSSKPVSFVLQPEGENPIKRPVKSWADLLCGVCALLLERHPETFQKSVLSMSQKWFSESPDKLFIKKPIGGIQLYVQGGSAKIIKQHSIAIVNKFEAPGSSLSIEER